MRILGAKICQKYIKNEPSQGKNQVELRPNRTKPGGRAAMFVKDGGSFAKGAVGCAQQAEFTAFDIIMFAKS